MKCLLGEELEVELGFYSHSKPFIDDSARLAGPGTPHGMLYNCTMASFPFNAFAPALQAMALNLKAMASNPKAPALHLHLLCRFSLSSVSGSPRFARGHAAHALALLALAFRSHLCFGALALSPGAPSSFLLLLVRHLLLEAMHLFLVASCYY